MHQEDATIACLEEQVDCYRRLAKLAQQQHQHVAQNQTEALIDVLNSRREMLDRIQILEQTIGPAKKSWVYFLGSMDSSGRARADELLAETRRLLEEIMTADRDDMLVLQQHKLNLGREIKQAMSARSVNRSYGAAAYGKQASKMDIQR